MKTRSLEERMRKRSALYRRSALMLSPFLSLSLSLSLSFSLSLSLSLRFIARIADRANTVISHIGNCARPRNRAFPGAVVRR